MKLLLYIASLPEDELGKRQYPLGAGYLAAWVEQKLDDIEVKVTAEESDIYDYKPDILGISSVTQCYNSACRIAAEVKARLQIPVIIGGYHVSALPETMAREFDVGVMGEGELPLEQLLRIYQVHHSFPLSELEKVPGICYRDDRFGVVTTPPPPMLEMDSLPFPQRNISPGARNIYIFSSRGCAYRCQFCASTRHWGRLRTHSAEYFVSELKQLIDEYQATSIYLLDDLFFANRKRVAEIVQVMEREGILGKLSFHAFITSNLASEKTFSLAKQMNFKSIRFGAETGSDQLLRVMKGNWASVRAHQQCIELSHKYGFEVSAAFMLGTPGETIEDLDATVEFLEKNKGAVDINGLYLTTPIPGTPYWNLALEKGLVSNDMNWDRLNLDFGKTASFDFDNIIYLNAENVPLEVVREYYEHIRDNYMVQH